MTETKKRIISWIIGGILLVLVGFKDNLVATFRNGQDVEFTQDIKDVVLTDNFIEEIFKHKETKRQVRLVKKQGELEMMKRESQRVGLRVLLGRDMDIREEKVSKELAWAYHFCKVFAEKRDSIIDYRVEKKIKQILRGRTNLRQI